jgi:NAD(P)-dependent dehydrogenase (short-subunit alcohol dehydrogenase family)
VAECGIGGPVDELLLQEVAGHPSRPLSVGNDVRYRFAVNGEHDPLTASHRIDNLARAVPEVPDANLHVLRRSTLIFVWVPHPNLPGRPSDLASDAFRLAETERPGIQFWEFGNDGCEMTDRSALTVMTTGANSGIGLATALRVAALGFHSVGSVRSEAKASEVAGAGERAGVTVDTVLLDVTKARQSSSVINELRPWAIVNCAGYPGIGAIEDVTDSEARRQFETMVLAPMRLARLALPHMRQNGQGRIVNMSSIYGLATTPFSGWYQACKHALEAASDALRIEVARDGIRVSLVEPGGIHTGIWSAFEDDLRRHAGSAYDSGYQRSRIVIQAFSHVMGEPAGVAKAVGTALTVRAPRARYLVGYDARIIAAATPLIPTEIWDRMARIVTGL